MELTNEIPAPKEPQKADCPSASCCASFPELGPDVTTSTEERYRAALEHELALAEKQVELLKLRVEEGGHDHVKPFGTDAWKRAERLRAVLRHNSELCPPESVDNP